MVMLLWALSAVESPGPNRMSFLVKPNGAAIIMPPHQKVNSRVNDLLWSAASSRRFVCSITESGENSPHSTLDVLIIREDLCSFVAGPNLVHPAQSWYCAAILIASTS
ncbi:MAG: hypothetical protein U0Z53_09200 [Blastocatellia bacterium]